MIVREGEEGQVSDSDAIKGVEPFKTWAEKYSIVQNTLKLPACACVCGGEATDTRLYKGKGDPARSEEKQREVFQYACPAPGMGGARQ